MTTEKRPEPSEVLAALCDRYQLHEEIVRHYAWRAIASEFELAGELDIKLVHAMQDFQKAVLDQVNARDDPPEEEESVIEIAYR